MKVLLHSCCGPCTTYCYEALSNEGHEIYGFFYNPNIHPLTEYRKRKESLDRYADQVGLKMIGRSEYGLTEFVRKVVFREKNRCQLCYQMRLEATARMAQRSKFDAFTTTLLISPYQDYQKIVEIGNNLATEYQLEFLARDFRQGYARSIELSKKYGLYRQQYCGCIYSEEERYRHQKKV